VLPHAGGGARVRCRGWGGGGVSCGAACRGRGYDALPRVLEEEGLSCVVRRGYHVLPHHIITHHAEPDQHTDANALVTPLVWSLM